jgi:hypothetical protein
VSLPTDTAMLPLPAHFAGIVLAFAPLFVHRSWHHAQRLLIGAILTPGCGTVTSVLSITSLAQERRFVNVHRILNQAAWRPRSGSRIQHRVACRGLESSQRLRRHRWVVERTLARFA